MQLITLDQLKKLAGSSSVDESLFDTSGSIEIGPGFKFQDICSIYDKKLKEFKTTGHIYLRQRLYNYMNADVLSKHCPPIELVGKGSSRTAYACIGGKCLKVAHNDAGVAQNKQEYKTTSRRLFKRSYECFAQSYGSNGKDFGLLLTECCAKADKEQLAAAFDVSSFEVIRAIMLEVGASHSSDIKTATSGLSKKAAEYAQHSKGFKAMQNWSKIADEAARFLLEMSKASKSQMTAGLEVYFHDI